MGGSGLRVDPLDVRPALSDERRSRRSASALRGFSLLQQGVFPNGRIKATSNQAGLVFATEAKIVFDTTVKDSPADDTEGDPDGSMADLTNNRIYARHAGWYIVMASIPWEVESSGGYRRARVKKNGATVEGTDTRDPIAIFNTFNNLVVPLQLDKDDYIELFGTHGVVAGLDVIATGEAPYLALTWVGL